MDEEKILGGAEDLKKPEAVLKDNVEKGNTLEQEPVFEESEQAQMKIKQAQDQISSSSAVSSEEDEVLNKNVQGVAELDKIEDQIQKLTEIATQDGLKMALKVARTLNSNYVLDKMHDRLIDEEELREVLINKGFIEKTE